MIMKNVFSIMLIAVLGLTVVFTGCKDEEPVIEPLPTALVQGTVKAQLDLNNANPENVPNGTRVIFRIDSRDLVQNPVVGYTYQVLQYETTVTDGTYSITLPSVVFAGVGVDITPIDFQYDQIQGDNSKIEKTYLGGAVTIATQADERYYVNLAYTPI
jgi:hypothetical protein